MKQITRMAALGVLLLAGANGTALANGTSAPEPTPVRYTPPAPEPEPEITPAPEAKRTGPYISAAIGLGLPSSLNADLRESKRSQSDVDNHLDLDNGLVLNGAIGYNFGSFRAEGALGYQRLDLSNSQHDSHITLTTLMANGYYDIETGSDFTPYVMGGVGVAHINTSWTDNDEDVFAWQIGAGVGYKVSENLTLDLGYRYLNPNKFNTNERKVRIVGGEFESHNVMLGLRRQF